VKFRSAGIGLLTLALGAGITVVPSATVESASATNTALPSALSSYLSADRMPDQWSLTSTHASSAWPVATGSGVTVAVIDTGVDATNPDLVGQVLEGAHWSPASQAIIAGSVTDNYGHGTHLAGIIAGKKDGSGITGIAPDAKILPINVNTDKELTGPIVAAGIDWATSHGAKVINLSLGFTNIAVTAAEVAPICTAVTKAVTAGVVVVAAAGNEGASYNLPNAPATCTGAISVAGLDPDLQVAYWSSFDGTVTVAAPGSDIYSSLPSFVTPARYDSWSGTSMASPFVAGVAALLLQHNPTWTPAQVTEQLENTAEDLGPAGVDPRYGHGAVDPVKALGITGVPAPATVEHLSAQGVGFGTTVDSNGSMVVKNTLILWTPDPHQAVTGYRITTYDSSGATTTHDVSSTTVRWVAPTTLAGYVVSACTAGSWDTTCTAGFSSTPFWVDATASSNTGFQVKAVQSLHGTFRKDGSLRITWTNPAANTGHADAMYIALNDTIVYTKVGSLPQQVIVPKGHVPAGDLSIDVAVLSSDDFSEADAVAKVTAQVPLSGSASRAGRGRYTISLSLAKSWAKKTCHRNSCPGVKVFVVAHGKVYPAWVNAGNYIEITVTDRPRAKNLTLQVTAAKRPNRALNMNRLVIRAR
jgi:hypothetical protein